MYRTLKEDQKTYKDVDPKDGIKGDSYKTLQLLRQDYVWEFLERTEAMGIHMFDGKTDMKLNRFYRTMLGTPGGVSTFDLGSV